MSTCPHEVLFRHAALILLAIHKVLRRQIALSGEKIPRHWSHFQCSNKARGRSAAPIIAEKTGTVNGKWQKKEVLGLRSSGDFQLCSMSCPGGKCALPMEMCLLHGPKGLPQILWQPFFHVRAWYAAWASLSRSSGCPPRNCSRASTPCHTSMGSPFMVSRPRILARWSSLVSAGS